MSTGGGALNHRRLTPYHHRATGCDHDATARNAYSTDGNDDTNPGNTGAGCDGVAHPDPLGLRDAAGLPGSKLRTRGAH
jgi:hypothetical protein